MSEPLSLARGYLVRHESLGVGLVLTVEGTGRNGGALAGRLRPGRLWIASSESSDDDRMV